MYNVKIKTIYSGNPASFTGKSGDSIESLTAAIAPVQDLHGYDHPWAAGAGKNKLPISSRQSGTSGGVTFTNNNDGSWTVDGTSGSSNVYVPGSILFQSLGVMSAGEYAASLWNESGSVSSVLGVRIGKGATSAYIASGNGSCTFTADGTSEYYFTFMLPSKKTADNERVWLQVEAGSSATTYAPYENICPITGFTGANIYVSPTQNQADATTYTSDWTSSAGTVYGGSYDAVSGKLKARPQYSAYNGETLVGPWLSSMDVYAAGTTPTTGAQVVDLGGTETGYSLTPQTVTALVGQNYVWSDLGSTVSVSVLSDSAFHTLAIADSPKTRCRIFFIGDGVDCTDDDDVQTNGTLLVGAVGDTDSNGRIGQDGIKFTEYYNPEYNVTIGRAVSSQVEMTLLNTDGALDNFTYGRCKIYLDVYDSANLVWIACPMGVYNIELPTRRKVQLIHAFGYDQMQKLDGICDSWWNSLNWTGGITLLQIVNSMATQIGVSVSTATYSAIVNSSVTYPTAPFDCVEKTYREVLELIAEATGTVARFDRDGALDLKWFGAAQIGGNTVEIDTDTIGNQCLSIDLAEYQVAAIDLLKVKIAEDDVGVTVGPGTNQYTILDNLFLDGSVATITTRTTAIYNRLNALGAYKPIQSKLIWDWSIEAGDIIDITRDSTTYATPIFQQTMVWRGGYVVSDVVNSGDNVRPVPSYNERTEYRVQSDLTAAIKTAESAIANIGVNLSPYFSNSFEDVYNSITNPTGYWNSAPNSYVTRLEDGWAQVVCDNIGGSGSKWPTFYNMPNEDLTDDKYTMLVELKDVVIIGDVDIWNLGDLNPYVPQYSSDTISVVGDGSLYITLNKRNVQNPTVLTRSGFSVTAGASLSCKIRISLYKHGYQGDYIPYVSDAYNSSVYREQTIYISKASATPTVTANTTWVTDATGNQNTWTTVRPVYDSLYPVLFVATQTQTMLNKGGTACVCTTPVVDQTTTVIDGGHITTGTIDAGVVNVTNINASNITSGTLSANYIQGGTMTVGGLNNTNGYIRILDSTGNYSGGVGASGITIAGKEPSAQSHVAFNSTFPEGFSLRDDTTSNQLSNYGFSVMDSTDEYAYILLNGYDNGTQVSQAKLYAYPYSSGSDHGAYLLLTGPDGLVRLNSDGTYAGDLTLTTGNLTVGNSGIGVLDVATRHCSKALSSAGWYRVLKTVDAPGEVFRFEICRIGSSSDNETHTIDYHMNYGGKNYFVDETSVSGNLYIDKIRCNYDSSYAYIDIHYNTSTESNVYIHFSAEGVRNVNLNTVSIGLSNVGPSPQNETMLATHDFIATGHNFTLPIYMNGTLIHS